MKLHNVPDFLPISSYIVDIIQEYDHDANISQNSTRKRSDRIDRIFFCNFTKLLFLQSFK